MAERLEFDRSAEANLVGDQERVNASLSGAIDAEGAIRLEKPAAGDLQIVNVDRSLPLAFGFDLADVEVTQTQADITLAFADGAKLVLVSLVPAAVSDVPPLVILPDGSVISSIELLDLAGSLEGLVDVLGDIDLASGPPQTVPATEYAQGLPEAATTDLWGSVPEPLARSVAAHDRSGPTDGSVLPSSGPESFSGPAAPTDNIRSGDPTPLVPNGGGPVGPTDNVQAGDPTPLVPDGSGPVGPTDNVQAGDSEPVAPDGSGGASNGPSPEPTVTVEETAYVLSNQSAGQTYQDRSNSFTLPNHGPDSTVTLTGRDMGIDGVSDRAQVTISRDGDGEATVSLDSAWNSIKNVYATNEGAANVTLDNFVHADVDLGDGGNSTVTITGAKRGFVRTGDGDDEISIEAQSNNAGWSNKFAIDSGAGDDSISVTGAPIGVSQTDIQAGAGDDRVVSRNLTADTVRGGSGDDRIDTGRGDDEAYGDEGEDTLIGGAGADKLDGGDDRDILRGGSGDDVVIGGLGDDVLMGDGMDKFQAGGTGRLADWGNVSVSARNIDGSEGSVAESGKWGLGVRNAKGSDDDGDSLNPAQHGNNQVSVQINHAPGYGPDGGSEALVVELNEPANAFRFEFTRLFDSEGEVGRWTAYDADGTVTGTGTFGPADVTAKNGVGWIDVSQEMLDGDVGRVAFTAEAYAGAERSNDSSDYLIRAFEWTSGDETDIGAAGDDVLDGGAGNDLIQGGEDDGSVSFASRINVEFVDSNAGYNNSFGYYRAADDGDPVDGRIIWNNLNDTPDGATYSIRLNDVDVDDVGFFLVPNGDRKNAGLDLDQGDKVRFRLEDGEWVAQTKVDGQWTTLDGQSSNAYFSDKALNPDDIAQMQAGADGAQGWEDLRGGGDRDYNDAEVRANVNWEVRGFEAGDRLTGGEGDDVFLFQRGNGVDEIDDFQIGSDRLVINGYEAGEVDFIQSGNDTVLKLGDSEAVKLKDVDADVLAGRTGSHTAAVDADSDGHLDVGDVIDVQDDFFTEGGGTAPSAQDTSVVFLTPVAPEPGLGGDEDDSQAV